MNKTFSEKLTEILDEAMGYPKNYPQGGTGDSLLEAHKAIMELVRELVPDKASPSWFGEMAIDKDHHWDSCREEILKRLDCQS